MSTDSPSTTDRLADIREALADWMEHDDCDALLASDSALLELLNELETKRAEVQHLRERLDTAEGRLAHFAAQHQPHDNLFKTCRTCKDGYGEPLPWPCADAKALGLGEEPSDV